MATGPDDPRLEESLLCYPNISAGGGGCQVIPHKMGEFVKSFSSSRQKYMPKFVLDLRFVIQLLCFPQAHRKQLTPRRLIVCLKLQPQWKDKSWGSSSKSQYPAVH